MLVLLAFGCGGGVAVGFAGRIGLVAVGCFLGLSGFDLEVVDWEGSGKAGVDGVDDGTGKGSSATLGGFELACDADGRGGGDGSMAYCVSTLNVIDRGIDLSRDAGREAERQKLSERLDLHFFGSFV